MTIITETQELAIKRNALKTLVDTNVRELRDVKLHKLTWSELEKLKSVATREASSLAGVQATFEGKGKTSPDLEEAFQGLTQIVRSCEAEKDIRAADGDKGPRDTKESRSTIAKRPKYDAVNTADGAEVAVADVALRPDQRFKAWATARGVPEHSGVSLGAHLRSMITGARNDAEQRALSEGSDSAGGYTVPTILSSQLIDLLRADSVLTRAGAQTVPLTSDRNVIAKVLTDPQPAWRLEAGALTETDPTFGPVEMNPKSLAMRVKLSLELMEDSVNLEQQLPNVVASAMAVELDRIGLFGTGTDPEPRGIVNTVGIGTFAQDGTTSGYGNLSRARTAIMTANAMPTAFIGHPRTEGEFVDLTATDNQPLNAPTAISAIPMLTTTSVPVDLGTGSDESTIVAGDFSKLMIGVRQDLRIELIKSASYVGNLQYDLIAHLRADFAVTHPEAFYTITGVQPA